MARAANHFVCVGPIPSMGAGKTVPAARNVAPVDHLLSTYSFLSSISEQSVQRSAAPAGEAYPNTTTGPSSGDAGDAGAKTAYGHSA
jgi:hypothetical protein